MNRSPDSKKTPAERAQDIADAKAGHAARMDRRGMDACPFRPGTKRAGFWRAGWRRADAFLGT